MIADFVSFYFGYKHYNFLLQYQYTVKKTGAVNKEKLKGREHCREVPY